MLLSGMRGLAPALLAVLAALTASGASARDYVSGDGHEYSISCNANGFVLTSRGPVTRMFEAGAASRPVRQQREVIYFGRSCDAGNKVYGSGKWCQANGGFSANAGSQEYFFPRQEPFCNGDYADYNCLCE